MVVDEDNAKNPMRIVRFGDKKRIDEFSKGIISFSCAGAYIRRAMDGNYEQGDKLEAVFAHVSKDDSCIAMYKKELGSDLEIVDENDEFVFLRRISARKKPVFCFYQLKAEDFDEKKVSVIDEEHLRIKYEYDKRMFSGFSDKPVVISVDACSFLTRLMRVSKSVFGIKEGIKVSSINYIDYSERFIIPISDEYNELFVKDINEYGYQREGRIVLRNMEFYSEWDRLLLKTDGYLKNDYKITCGEHYIDFICKGKRI